MPCCSHKVWKYCQAVTVAKCFFKTVLAYHSIHFVLIMHWITIESLIVEVQILMWDQLSCHGYWVQLYQKLITIESQIINFKHYQDT